MSVVFESRACTVLYRLATAVPAEAGSYLLPANVCPVVPLTLLTAGRGFEFVDIDSDSLHMSEELLLRRLVEPGKSPVAAIVFVRTYGAETDALPLFRRVRELENSPLIIDDRCLCRPVTDAQELDSQEADAVVFSTGYAKQVDIGFGGFGLLADGVAYGDARRRFDPSDLRQAMSTYEGHTRERSPIYRGDPDNERIRTLVELGWLDTTPPSMDWDDYRALVLSERERAESHKARINAVYRSLIPDVAQLPSAFQSWRFHVRVPRPAALLEALFAAGQFGSDHYYPASELFGGSFCAAASELQAGIVNLFNDSRVSESDAEQIGRIVARHLDEA